MRQTGDSPADVGDITTHTANQLKDLNERLSAAHLQVASPRRIVSLVYDGHGEIIEMTIKEGAQRQYAADSMADHVTHALRTADRALQALLHHAFGGVTIGDDTASGWAKNPPGAAETVSVCFGGRES